MNLNLDKNKTEYFDCLNQAMPLSCPNAHIPYRLQNKHLLTG